MDKTQNSRKMRTKEYIYAGAFCAIYLILMLIIVMGSTVISPVLYIISPLTVGLVCGTVYMLYVTKVRKLGAVIILGVLFSLIACSSYIYSLIMGIVVALLAELVIFLGKYKSKKMYSLSFIVFNLNMAAPFLMLVMERERFLSLTGGYHGEDMASAMAAVTPSWIYYAILALALAGGIGGAIIGSNLIKKHFEKAGIV